MVEIAESAKFYSGDRLLRVVNSGFYDESELVEVCYDEDQSNFAIGAAQANYIAYGHHLGDIQDVNGIPEGDETSIIDEENNNG